jgi:hypothetical protein
MWRALALVLILAAPKPTVEWEKKRIERLGLEVDVPKGAELTEVAWDEGGGTVFGAHALGPNEVVRFNVREGPGEDLEEFRRDHQGWTYEKVKAITVCNRPARLLRATHPEQNITCVMTPTGNHPAWIPPSVAVTLVFEHRGYPTRVTYEAESKRAAELDFIRARFLESVRCF